MVMNQCLDCRSALVKCEICEDPVNIQELDMCYFCIRVICRGCIKHENKDTGKTECRTCADERGEYSCKNCGESDCEQVVCISCKLVESTCMMNTCGCGTNISWMCDDCRKTKALTTAFVNELESAGYVVKVTPT